MPLNKYYGGHGEQVMSEMMKKYGEEKGKSVFYATANKHPKLKPEARKVMESKMKRMHRGG